MPLFPLFANGAEMFVRLFFFFFFFFGLGGLLSSPLLFPFLSKFDDTPSLPVFFFSDPSFVAVFITGISGSCFQVGYYHLLLLRADAFRLFFFFFVLIMSSFGSGNLFYYGNCFSSFGYPNVSPFAFFFSLFSRLPLNDIRLSAASYLLSF